jgi:hypothetical protein
MYKLEESVYELLYRAGSRTYRPVRRPGLLDQFEFYTLSKTLAPNEFEYTGGRKEEWNLFESFIGEEDGVHDLSGMLERWERAVVRSNVFFLGEGWLLTGLGNCLATYKSIVVRECLE